MTHVACEIRPVWPRMQDLCGVERAAAARYREVGYDPSGWDATSAEEFGEYAARGLLWVAVVEGRAAGFAMVDVYGADFHLEEIDVLPEFQGHGIGARLIEAVIAEALARKMDAVTLRTFRTTPWSVGLYERMGFREWKPEPMPEHLRELAAGEISGGLKLEERLTMRLGLEYTSASREG